VLRTRLEIGDGLTTAKEKVNSEGAGRDSVIFASGEDAGLKARRYIYTFGVTN
jgi:hypothetical protein